MDVKILAEISAPAEKTHQAVKLKTSPCCHRFLKNFHSVLSIKFGIASRLVFPLDNILIVRQVRIIGGIVGFPAARMPALNVRSLASTLCWQC